MTLFGQLFFLFMHHVNLLLDVWTGKEETLLDIPFKKI